MLYLDSGINIRNTIQLFEIFSEYFFFSTELNFFFQLHVSGTMIPPQISTPSKYKTLKYFLVKKMQFDLS